MQNPAVSNVVKINPASDETHLNNAIEATQMAAKIRADLANDISELGVESVLGLFNSYGVFRDSNRIDTRDLMMLESSIQSMLYRYYGIEHPLHDIIEDAFEIEEEIEE